MELSLISSSLWIGREVGFVEFGVLFLAILSSYSRTLKSGNSLVRPADKWNNISLDIQFAGVL